MLRVEWEGQSELERMKEKQKLEKLKDINADLMMNNEFQRK